MQKCLVEVKNYRSSVGFGATRVMNCNESCPKYLIAFLYIDADQCLKRPSLGHCAVLGERIGEFFYSCFRSNQQGRAFGTRCIDAAQYCNLMIRSDARLKRYQRVILLQNVSRGVSCSRILRLLAWQWPTINDLIGPRIMARSRSFKDKISCRNQLFNGNVLSRRPQQDHIMLLQVVSANVIAGLNERSRTLTCKLADQHGHSPQVAGSCVAIVIRKRTRVGHKT